MLGETEIRLEPNDLERLRRSRARVLALDSATVTLEQATEAHYEHMKLTGELGDSYGIDEEEGWIINVYSGRVFYDD